MAVIVQTDFVGIDEDLTHPRIGYERATGTLATSSADAGFAGTNALTPLTYTAWKPLTVPADWQLSFASAKTISYLGVAVHNAGSRDATITLRRRIGTTWSNWPNVPSATPVNDDPILFLFGADAVDGVGIRVTGSVCRVGVIAAGSVMEWPRRATWTGLPITESRQFRYNVNESDTGNWLGRTQVSDGLDFQVQIDNLSEAYRTGDFKDFASHCNTGDATFFITPRPLGYRDEVAYAWSNETVRMTRETPNKAVSGSVQLSLRGYRAP